MNRIGAFLACCLMAVFATGQEYQGVTGLLHVPTAETDSVGTFRGGMAFMHKDFMPARLRKKNTFGYVFGITPFRWLEMSYGATMLYMHKNSNPKEEMGYYNEDRRVNAKVTPLYEGKWWPSLALGMEDVGRWQHIQSGEGPNNYFQNIYAVASKHFDIKGWELGAHLAYRYYTRNNNTDRKGVAGGVTVRPAFYRPLRAVVEWDGLGVNAGVDVLLWRRLFLQAALVHGHGFMGGVSYHYTIPH